MDEINELVRFENGELTKDESVVMFQRLINSGTAFELGGWYADKAIELRYWRRGEARFSPHQSRLIMLQAGLSVV